MMAGLISDAAHRMAAEAKRAQTRQANANCKKPNYISCLLRRRRGSLPPYAAEADGALGCGLKTFRAAVAARYGHRNRRRNCPIVGRPEVRDSANLGA